MMLRSKCCLISRPLLVDNRHSRGCHQDIIWSTKKIGLLCCYLLIDKTLHRGSCPSVFVHHFFSLSRERNLHLGRVSKDDRSCLKRHTSACLHAYETLVDLCAKPEKTTTKRQLKTFGKCDRDLRSFETLLKNDYEPSFCDPRRAPSRRSAAPPHRAWRWPRCGRRRICGWLRRLSPFLHWPGSFPLFSCIPDVFNPWR